MSATATEVPLPPEAARIAAAIALGKDGELAIDADDLVDFVDEVIKPRSAAAREALATGLLGIAIKSERLAQQNTKIVVAQLGFLAGLVLRDLLKAERTLASAGVDQRALDSLGAVQSSLPLSARKKVEGALSPVGLRMREGTKKR